MRPDPTVPARRPPRDEVPGPSVSRETPPPPSGPTSGPGAPEPATLVPEVIPAWLRPVRDEVSAYAAILAGAGVQRGLLGPREVPRLWERHLLNCLVVADPAAGLVPADATVIDIGSGAGLPGLAWALARPDLQVILIEPLLRRSAFLREAVADLDVTDRVAVRRGRAEELAGELHADVVTARAVAPLARLVGWAAPVTRPGGVILALKGASAEREVERDRAALDRAGIRRIDIVRCGAGQVEPPTTVVRLRPGRSAAASPRHRRPGRGGTRDAGTRARAEP